MRIISRKAISELRLTFPDTDHVGGLTVFNIGGNKYRLITAIHYNTQKVFIRHILTHSEYDKEKRRATMEIITLNRPNGAPINIDVATWTSLSNVLKVPQTEKEYNEKVAYLNTLVDIVKEDEHHPFASLLDLIGILIENYENEHFEEPSSDAIGNLRFLMEQHNLKQKDLTELGSPGVISEILNRKRKLNIRQIKALSKRFHVSETVFID